MILIFLIVFLLMNFSCPSKKIEKFDADCYLKAFPDVAQAGVNPLTHYKNFGKKEIMDGTRTKPNCDLSLKDNTFDADCYLKAFPDVANAGVDALTHYKNYGKKEIENGTRTKPNCNLSLTGTTSQSGTIDFNKLSIRDKAKYLCQHDDKSPFLHDDLNNCISNHERYNKRNITYLDEYKQVIMNENNGSMPKNCVSFCDDGSGYQPLTKHSKDVGYVLCSKSKKLMNKFAYYIKLCQNSVAHQYQNKGVTLDRLLQMS